MTDRPITLCVTGPFEIEMRPQQKAQAWDAFLAGGTNHSARAATLPYIMRRCEREGIPYILNAAPGVGYFIEPSRRKP